MSDDRALDGCVTGDTEARRLSLVNRVSIAAAPKGTLAPGSASRAVLTSNASTPLPTRRAWVRGCVIMPRKFHAPRYGVPSSGGSATSRAFRQLAQT